MTSPVVFTLAYHTWADAVDRDLSWSADQMMFNLLRDRACPRLLYQTPSAVTSVAQSAVRLGPAANSRMTHRGRWSNPTDGVEATRRI